MVSMAQAKKRVCGKPVPPSSVYTWVYGYPCRELRRQLKHLEAIITRTEDGNSLYRIPLNGRTVGHMLSLCQRVGLQAFYGEGGHVTDATGSGEKKRDMGRLLREAYKAIEQNGIVTYQDLMAKVFGPEVDNLWRIHLELDNLARTVYGLPLSSLKGKVSIGDVLADYIGKGQIDTIGTDAYAVWQERAQKLLKTANII